MRIALLCLNVSSNALVRTDPIAKVLARRDQLQVLGFRWGDGVFQPYRDEFDCEIVGRFREGDIRSCYADIAQARDALGFVAQVPLEEGIADLASWVMEQSSVGRSAEALDELRSFRLIR